MFFFLVAQFIGNNVNQTFRISVFHSSASSIIQEFLFVYPYLLSQCIPPYILVVTRAIGKFSLMP